eukprot:16432882-Heterocapsa_arctica.AAC.1
MEMDWYSPLAKSCNWYFRSKSPIAADCMRSHERFAMVSVFLLKSDPTSHPCSTQYDRIARSAWWYTPPAWSRWRMYKFAKPIVYQRSSANDLAWASLRSERNQYWGPASVKTRTASVSLFPITVNSERSSAADVEKWIHSESKVLARSK